LVSHSGSRSAAHAGRVRRNPSLQRIDLPKMASPVLPGEGQIVDRLTRCGVSIINVVSALASFGGTYRYPFQEQSMGIVQNEHGVYCARVKVPVKLRPF
jgi:hypothetical protein